MNKRQLMLVGFVVLAALMRLLPHPPNMTPIAAMALFGGAYFRDRRLAFFAPLAAMLLADLALAWTQYGPAALSSQPLIYVCLLAYVGMGLLIRERRSVVNVALAALTCSVLFYVVTNFGVWAFQGDYPRNLPGLADCYVAAIPFFRNTLAGDLAFTAILFGGFALAEKCAPSLRDEQLAAA